MSTPQNSKTEADVLESYGRALQDLTFNSKPIITGLTVKAKEQQAYARGIARLILEHFEKCPVSCKLPCLYLIDSICKNLADLSPYLGLFAEDIVGAYCAAYLALPDDKTRREFLRVFGLWHGLMPEGALREIEHRLKLRRSAGSKRANSENPPLQQQQIQAHPPFVNSYHAVPPPIYPYPPPPAAVQPGHYHPYHHPVPGYPMHQRLSPMAAGILNQLRTVLLSAPGTFAPSAVPDLLYRLAGLGELDGAILRDLDGRCRLPDPRPALDCITALLPDRTAFPAAPAGAVSAAVDPHRQHTAAPTATPQLPLMPLMLSPDLLASLPAILSKTPPIPPTAAAALPPHHALYSALPHQCTQCGFRFPATDTGKDDYRIHLDAHFRRNRRLKERTKKVLARDWLPRLEDWEVGGVSKSASVEKQVPIFFDAPSTTKKSAAEDRETPEKEQNVPAGERGRDQLCPVCNDPIDIFWDNDADEWMFRSAVIEGDDICHRSCVSGGAKGTSKRASIQHDDCAGEGEEPMRVNKKERK